MSQVAVISFKQLGDILLLQPAIRALCQQAQAPIDLITKPGIEPLIELMPGAATPKPIKNYDLLWVFEHGSKASRKAFFTKSTQKNLIITKERYRRWFHPIIFSQVIIEPNKSDYIALHFHRIVSKKPTKFSPPALTSPPSSWKPNAHLPEEFILINPTSAWESKAWAAKKWAQTIYKLTKQTNIPIVLTGGSSEWEKNHTKEISELTDGSLLNLAGKTSLKEILYLASKARFILSIDGFIAHLGTAFQIPTLTLFGPSKWQNWFWPSPLSSSLTAKDHSSEKRPSLNYLPENIVVDEALSLLNLPPPTS